jgi:hypothetical protein
LKEIDALLKKHENLMCLFDLLGSRAIFPGKREIKKGQESRESGNGKSLEVKPNLDLNLQHLA